MKEVLSYYDSKIKKAKFKKLKVTKGQFILVSLHSMKCRQSEYFKEFLKILNYLSESQKEISSFTHPRTKKS